MGWIDEGWDGEQELWKLAWIYGALFIFLGHVACTLLRIFTDISIDSPSSGAGMFISVMEVLYTLWLLISLWRCAFNVKWSIWAYCTRFIVICCVLLFCTLSIKERKPLLPEQVVAEAGAVLKSPTSQWLNMGQQQPAPKKKPNFTVKVNRI